MKPCEDCGGTGIVEILGDGEGFEVDVIDTKPCPVCDGLGEVAGNYEDEEDEGDII